MTAKRYSARRSLAVVSISLAVSLVLPAAASAWVLPSDVVAGRRAGGDVALAKAAPDVRQTAGILVTGDGRVLWERSADRRLPMASTTKIMSALCVLEQAKMQEDVTVTGEAAAVDGSGIDLRAGEKMRVSELLRAVLIHSANDAAFALADHVGGSIPGFVAVMNTKARELGLESTAYRNPHGLDEPGHYTSARDLATLTIEAMKDPTFRDIVAMRKARLPGPGEGRTVENSNRLLWTFEGATGVKTGFTDDAGYCLVASAQREGVELFAVVMGAEDSRERFDQGEALLEWGFEHFETAPLVSREETLGPVQVTDYLSVAIDARPTTGTVSTVFDLDGEVTRKVDLRRRVGAPVKVGQKLGTVTVMQGCRVIAEVPLVSASAVRAPTFGERVRIIVARLARRWLGPDSALAKAEGL